MSFADLSPDTAQVPLSELTASEALQAAIPVAVCLAVGLASGHTKAGAIAASGAFTVGFAPFHAISKSSSLSMVITGLGIAIMAFLGSLFGESEISLLLGMAIVAALTAMIGASGRHAYWVAQQMAIYFVVSAYFSLGGHNACLHSSLLLTGAGLSIGAYLLRWSFGQRSSWPSLRSDVLDSWAESIEAMRQSYPESPADQHAIRLAVALVLATFVYKHFNIQNGYWIPMTALVVMRPDWAVTRSRGIARIVGTTLGALLASLVSHFFSAQSLSLAIFAVVFALGCYALQGVNYAALTCCTTCYIVFLLAFGGFSEHRAIVIRTLCTFVGAAIAVGMDGLWPRPVVPTP
jgi:uncharacterized membrane protein YccC